MHRRYNVLRGRLRFVEIVRTFGLDLALFTSSNGGRTPSADAARLGEYGGNVGVETAPHRLV